MDLPDRDAQPTVTTHCTERIFPRHYFINPFQKLAIGQFPHRAQLCTRVAFRMINKRQRPAMGLFSEFSLPRSRSIACAWHTTSYRFLSCVMHNMWDSIQYSPSNLTYYLYQLFCWERVHYKLLSHALSSFVCGNKIQLIQKETPTSLWLSRPIAKGHPSLKRSLLTNKATSALF